MVLAGANNWKVLDLVALQGFLAHLSGSWSDHLRVEPDRARQLVGVVRLDERVQLQLRRARKPRGQHGGEAVGWDDIEADARDEGDAAQHISGAVGFVYFVESEKHL